VKKKSPYGGKRIAVLEIGVPGKGDSPSGGGWGGKGMASSPGDLKWSTEKARDSTVAGAMGHWTFDVR